VEGLELQKMTKTSSESDLVRSDCRLTVRTIGQQLGLTHFDQRLGDGKNLRENGSEKSAARSKRQQKGQVSRFLKLIENDPPLS